MRSMIDINDEVVIAEAAAWLARLQGPERTPQAEAAFKAWLRDPAHARAFALATDTWETIPGAARLPPASKPTASRVISRAMVAACAAVIICVLGVAAYQMRDPVYSTDVGQQQTFVLGDGTRVALNTNSRLAVNYSPAERRIRLDRGEAMFEVAKNPRRPFIVEVGDEQVRALGTTFTVRRDAGKLAVVLLEGRVEVTRRPAAQAPATKVASLLPGERLTVRADAGIVMDRPKLDMATAWRQGEIMFDDELLIDALGELNRYGDTQIVVGDPSVAGLRVSGIFATRDPAEFADAMAHLHHLRIERLNDRIVLRR